MRRTVRTAARIENVLLGRELKRLREKAGLTVRELGKRLDKHHSYVVRVEQGVQVIDVATLIDFVRITGDRAGDIVNKIEDQAASGEFSE